MTTKRKKYKLRDLEITRVDQVDLGANQHADIVLAKAQGGVDPRMKDLENKLKQRQTGAAQGGQPKPAAPKPPPKPAPKPGGAAPVPGAGAMPQRPAALPPRPGGPAPAPGGAGPATPPGAQPPGAPPPLPPREGGPTSRLSRIRPDDFERAEDSPKGMSEWTLPDEKLPEGIEEVMVSMASGGDKPSYQWMIDPIAGPPLEGQAKSAEEAFMQVRAKLTEHAGGFGMEFGAFPQGPPAPHGNHSHDMPDEEKKKPPVLKALADRRRREQLAKRLGVTVADAKEADVAVDDLVNAALEKVTKGLITADVFVETATGEDLRDILPAQLLDEMSRELSAALERRG